ncbi:hypothetical protein BDV06DRAFT_221355 [Aspergillus oleicola]
MRITAYVSLAIFLFLGFGTALPTPNAEGESEGGVVRLDANDYVRNSWSE